MNPYLEQEDVWQGFHNRMIPAISDALSPQVDPYYIVDIEEQIYIHEPTSQQRVLAGRADVGVSQGKMSSGEVAANVGVLEAPERVLIPAVVDMEKHTFLEIRDRMNHQLITVIEVLSPTNKRAGADRQQYLSKRLTIMRSQAHFVEIDLLRGWQRMPSEKASVCDYCLLVSRVEDRPHAGFWPVGLRERLPTIPIPLRSPHVDAHLDLQEVLHGVYDRAHYKSYIYDGTPTPPLTAEDRVWAVSLVGK